MSALSTRFPHLSALHDELTRLATEECARNSQNAQQPRDTREVHYPGLGRCALDPPQWRVACALLKALLEADARDVPEADLLREGGSAAASLAEVFAGSPAWGRLVVPGARPGTYRLASLPVVGGG